MRIDSKQPQSYDDNSSLWCRCNNSILVWSYTSSELDKSMRIEVLNLKLDDHNFCMSSFMHVLDHLDDLVTCIGSW